VSCPPLLSPIITQAILQFQALQKRENESWVAYLHHNQGRKEGSLRVEEKLRGEERVSRGEIYRGRKNLEEAEEDEEAEITPFLSLTVEVSSILWNRERIKLEGNVK
jgi:hypothetical protein